jgi:hypothetical protein
MARNNNNQDEGAFNLDGIFADFDRRVNDIQAYDGPILPEPEDQPRRSDLGSCYDYEAIRAVH